jgi:glycosyltransferase involved in cell wall biosynthesis
MRIAHVTATFPPDYSGTGMVCYNNALQLANLGHDVTVFTAEYPMNGEYAPQAFKISRLKPQIKIGNAPLLINLIKEIKQFDLIHLHHPFIFGTEIILLIAKLRNIPLLITHHNDLIGDGKRKFLFKAYSLLSGHYIVKAAKKIIVPTKDHARASILFRYFANRWEDIVEIPNSVDIHRFHPGKDGRKIRQKFDINEDEINILFVGALDRAHHYRRIDVLLKAAAALNDLNVHLTFVGDGDRKNYFIKLSEKLGLESNVHFVGKVSQERLPDYYASADVLVLPSSIQESFGMVLIEAMACEKPIIASNLPGVRSIFTSGREGLLVEPADVNDLKEKLSILIKNPELRKQMGKLGRQLVEKNYSCHMLGKKLEKLYFEVLRNE